MKLRSPWSYTLWARISLSMYIYKLISFHQYRWFVRELAILTSFYGDERRVPTIKASSSRRTIHCQHRNRFAIVVEPHTCLKYTIVQISVDTIESDRWSSPCAHRAVTLQSRTLLSKASQPIPGSLLSTHPKIIKRNPWQYTITTIGGTSYVMEQRDCHCGYITGVKAYKPSRTAWYRNVRRI